MTLSIFSRLATVIGRGCFTVMTSRACLELIMTWSMCLANGDITTAAARSRKVAPASLVVRGSVQLVAAIATQLCSFTVSELASVSVTAWQHVRASLEQHQRKRVQQRQFRQSPTNYLAPLEQKLLQLVLPV